MAIAYKLFAINKKEEGELLPAYIDINTYIPVREGE